MSDQNYTRLLEEQCSQPRLAEWSIIVFVAIALVMGIIGAVRFHHEGEFKPAVLS